MVHQNSHHSYPTTTGSGQDKPKADVLQASMLHNITYNEVFKLITCLLDEVPFSVFQHFLKLHFFPDQPIVLQLVDQAAADCA